MFTLWGKNGSAGLHEASVAPGGTGEWMSLFEHMGQVAEWQESIQMLHMLDTVLMVFFGMLVFNGCDCIHLAVFSIARDSRMESFPVDQ